LPPTIGTEDFNVAYQKALIGPIDATPEQRKPAAPGTLAALIVSYKQSADYARLRSTTKKVIHQERCELSTVNAPLQD